MSDQPMFENPFDEKTANVSLQMAVIRADPDKAKRLISAVGKKPRDFGWSGDAVVTDKRGMPY